ncbi:MAG: hypothetical protein JO156_13370 [Solirubrobacterales bacterium]|nr:hypothetical protein [Solirubrobacterales bacterium]
MAQDAFQDLQQQLGSEVPLGFLRLDPEQLRHLADAIEDADRRHAQALSVAGEQALGHVPKLLRARIRALVG